MLKRLLFRFAKAPFMGKIVGTVFRFFPWAIPAQKASNTKHILAFPHPQPAYHNHMILSPKRAIQNLQQLATERFHPYFLHLWNTVQNLAMQRPEYADSFVLVANGGKRQEVQQVHFHLFTNHEFVREYSPQPSTDPVFFRNETVCILAHPNPNWEIHYVIIPASSSQPAETTSQTSYFQSILQSIDLLNAEFPIVQNGYSLVCEHSKQATDIPYPIFHIVSGQKRQ